MKQPNQILQEMMSDFRKNTTDLLKVTTTDDIFQANEKYLYGKLHMKASHRLSRLLSVDKSREILVLFSNFFEQQVRTIDLVRETINNSNGRLEPTIAIVVHKDRHGNSYLKKWGRERGLSILPIYHIDNQFPTSEQLEKILIGELYSHDPFDITGPVSDDSQFYGRRTEAQDIARKLQNGTIKSCLGIRKIGKTSLLNRIIQECVEQHPCECIVFDCSKDQIWTMNASQLMKEIECRINKEINKNDSLISKNTEEISIVNATEILSKTLVKSEKTIILFFDEIDYITPSSPTGKHWITEFNIFWRNLRTVYQDTKRLSNNLSIFISGVSSKWFSVEAINEIENAALQFVPEEYLSPLARGASVPMIKTLARTSGLIFDVNNASIIAEFCSDIPFWIRKACSFIHKQIDTFSRPTTFTEEQVKNYLDVFLETEGGTLAQVALKHLFRVYPELQNVCLKCYKGDTSKLPKPFLSKLEKYGIISNLNNPKISGSMMLEGVKLIIEDVETESINPSQNNNIEQSVKTYFNTTDEWADELAVINKKRNILEKRLRGIVVNFIRFDYLATKKGNVTDRILKIIEEEKKKIYKELEPEKILEKYLWTDLCKLILKEWLLFEKLFNDKNDFNLYYGIINDRLDAHAKNAEPADIALYTKAVDWFENKIRING